jgi:hypothetical protein
LSQESRGVVECFLFTVANHAAFGIAL